MVTGTFIRHDTRLLVEQSEPTLLRVLARRLGWDGMGLLELRVIRSVANDHRWWLISVNKSGTSRWRTWLPEHISTDLDYLEALAAAVVWYARLARMTDSKPGESAGGGTAPAALARLEAHHGLSTWAVQR